jgi:hypothetical protein
MPKPRLFVLVVVLGTALAVGFASPSAASKASTTKFCDAVSAAGGSTSIAQAATSGQGASALVGALKKLEKSAPSKSLKSSLTTLATLFGQVGSGGSVTSLGAKDLAKMGKAATTFTTFVGDKCTSAPSPTATASGGLSGTWSGQYSGASQGTFTLTWQQSGGTLSGTIMISDFGGAPIPINGTVNGSTISFGTVGTQAITYTGSASGSTMSGTYQAPTGGGNWSATKAS